jgi:hypothetical protein
MSLATLSSQSIFRSLLTDSLGNSPWFCLTLFMSKVGLSSATGHSELKNNLQPWKFPATTFLLIFIPLCQFLLHCPTQIPSLTPVLCSSRPALPTCRDAGCWQSLQARVVCKLGLDTEHLLQAVTGREHGVEPLAAAQEGYYCIVCKCKMHVNSK